MPVTFKVKLKYFAKVFFIINDKKFFDAVFMQQAPRLGVGVDALGVGDGGPVGGKATGRVDGDDRVSAAVGAAGEVAGDDLADRVYSAVPARVFGRQQTIEIGHYSGRSNVVYWLREHGYEPSDELVDHVFGCAKEQNRTLTTEELRAIVDAKLAG